MSWYLRADRDVYRIIGTSLGGSEGSVYRECYRRVAYILKGVGRWWQLVSGEHCWKIEVDE